MSVGSGIMIRRIVSGGQTGVDRADRLADVEATGGDQGEHAEHGADHDRHQVERRRQDHGAEDQERQRSAAE